MKRLAIFCDGTWNRADQVKNGVLCPTNVVKLAVRVAKLDGQIPQVCYYDHGVGTGNSLDRLSGGAFGNGLEENLYDAYRFLILNYVPGDEIYLFGFSRGAFTVRSLAGMIRKCGILRRSKIDQYLAAISTYCDANHPDHESPCTFRKDYSVAGDGVIPIRMIGVWDTVGALGIPLRGLRSIGAAKHRFHDVELSGTVERAYQALAIDEQREPFEAARWAPFDKPGQVIEQTWFCGVHSDVGGGYPETGLSDIALQWMMEKAVASGLKIHDEAVQAFSRPGNPLGTLHDSRTGMYRLGRPHPRTIGMAASRKEQPTATSAVVDPTQSVHASVLARWDGDKSYRPGNLLRYFQQVGDPRATTG